MKLIRLFCTFACLVWGSSIFAQAPNLEFTLRYSTTFSRYEVYARPSATQPSFSWGPSQISIVAPSAIGDAAFNVTSIAGGAWLDNSQVYAPTIDPAHDFHGVGSLGAPTSFTANVEKLIFHFTLAGGGCVSGLRLYINGVDPNSSAPGMAGGDFSNTVFAIVPGMPGGYEAYISNYNNTGTSCNAPPVANDDVVSTNEDTPLTSNPLTNDTDPNGNIDPTTVLILIGPANGMASVNPVTGAITYTPNSNFNGSNTITYSVCDTGTPILCDTALFTITVNPINDPPVAINDVASTNEDTPTTITILANDTDVDGTLVPGTVDLDPATAGIQTTFTVPGQGTFTVNPATGVVTFTPASNFTGTTTPVQYAVCDNGTPLPAQCAQATITVTVNPINDAPIANNDVATTNEDTPTTITILANDTDVDGTLVPGTVDLDPATAGIQTTFTVPGQGTFTVNPATGVVTFTPASNFNGTTTPVQYAVCDNGTPLPAMCAQATLTVTVNPINDAPVANNDVASTNEDTPTTITILANDTDVDGTLVPATVDLDPATAGIQTTFTVPGHGTFTVNPATGVVTFTPASNFTGTTTPVQYAVCDNGTPLPAQCAQATITVTVNPINDAPIANNDVASTNEDTPTTITILANDTDVDGTLVPGTVDLDPATAGIQTTFTVPGQGTFTVNPATGVVTFTPVSNFNGTITPVQYTVCDNGTPLPAQCAQATITVTVNPINDAPVANNDVASTNEDTPTTITILANDTDVDGTLVPGTVDLDPATAGIQTMFTVPGQGTFIVNPATGVVTFTPVSNFTGTTTPVQYAVCDNGTPLPAMCAQATITVMVNAVNDAPVANNDTPSTNEDTPTTITILANDTDVDGTLDPATVDLDPATAGIQTTFTVPGQGTFTVNPATGVVTFTPASNFTGTTTPVQYAVCDNGAPLPAQCAQATITVTVNPINDAPVAVNDVASTNEDTPTTITILANDTDVDGTLVPATVDLDPATAGIQTTFAVPGQGTFTVNPATGVVTFTPVSNFTGTTTPVQYAVCDNGTPLPAMCAQATITVTVNPVNDAPVANNDTPSTNEDTPTTITILANDTDVDGTLVPGTVDLDPATAGIQTTFTVPGQGTFTVNPATGIVTFTPVSNFTGTTNPVQYAVCDNGTPLPAQCAQATITVTVNPINDAPIANNDVASTNEDTPTTITILANDTDVDGTLVPGSVDLDPATAGIQTTFTVPGQGTFTVNPAMGVVTFTPVLNFTGTTTPVQYAVCDNGTPLPAMCAQATITVTVNPVNDAPVANNDTPSTNEDTPTTITILANDTDVDGTLVPGSVDLDPATAGIQTTFTVPGQGTFTVNPATGVVTFTPVSNFNGTTTPVLYSVCDNGTPLPAMCAQATITVTVNPINDAPVANNDAPSTNEDTPVVFNPLVNDTDVENNINPASVAIVTGPTNGVATVNPVTGEITYTPNANFSGTDVLTYSVCDLGTPILCATATVTITVIFDPVAKLQVKVMLQGAMLGTSNGLMRDDLRAGGYLPLMEPYTAMANTHFTHVGGGGGETTTPAVLAANAGTPDAIVDWVFVELRSAADSSIVLQTRSALVQRDGDVVSAANGTSMLTFTGIVGQQLFVSVKHRNHLGVMTATKVVMTNDGTIVDFINASNTQVYDRTGAISYNGFEMVTVQGKRALWAGNANGNNKVKYQGTSSDNIPVLTQVLSFGSNTAGTYNYDLAFGYFSGDINMDGKVKYQGPSNDVSFIFVNVVGLYTALNTAALYNYDLFLEQLP